jgi:mono/diheme cytochrome c family protein
MDEAALVASAAVKMGMPESMVKRSAAARAKAQETTYEAILLEWAGVDASEIAAAGSVTAVSEEVAVVDAPAVPTPAPAAPAGGGMDEAALMAAASAKMGMPEAMLKRSAAARAKAQGTTVTAVLAEWAGVEAPAAAEAASPTPAEPAAPVAPAAPAAPAAATAPRVEVLGDAAAVASARPATPAPEPFETREEAVAAGALPRWLAALFIFIPAFAIAYALFLPNGPNCGDAGSLAVDPVTGLAVNCDMSDFGSQVADYFAMGSDTYAGIGCIACHGPSGGGVASFPAFTGGSLLTTFPEGQCSAQIEWISLGTAGWPDPTYGANNKPVGGSGAQMPAFATTLDPQEIAAVALYERVAFGGQDLTAALVDCGFTTGDPAAAMGG